MSGAAQKKKSSMTERYSLLCHGRTASNPHSWEAGTSEWIINQSSKLMQNMFQWLTLF